MQKIKQIEPVLRSQGMAALYLFGSTARGEAGTRSDVDLMCDINPESDLDLIGFIGLQQALADQLGTSVDLLERRSLKPRVKGRAEAEMIRIF